MALFQECVRRIGALWRRDQILSEALTEALRTVLLPSLATPRTPCGREVLGSFGVNLAAAWPRKELPLCLEATNRDLKEGRRVEGAGLLSVLLLDRRHWEDTDLLLEIWSEYRPSWKPAAWSAPYSLSTSGRAWG